MQWQEACERFRISSRYRQATFENNNITMPDALDLGRRWLKAPVKPSLYIYGEPGSGKTYFMVALFRHYVELGKHAIFIKSEDMDRELLQASLGKLTNTMGYSVSEVELLERYSEVACLFIDDFGTERDNDRIKQQYGTIIDRRVGDELPTILTSNLSIEALQPWLGSRICSRLQVGYQLEFPPIDLRKTMKKPLI